VKVTRTQVLAYRVGAQGLLRKATTVGELDVLDLGVQDAMGQPAAAAFDARLAGSPPLDGFGPGKRLALVWSLRGAPHVHRRKDLDALAGALYPLSEADAIGRLNETGPSVAKAGITGLEQFELALEAMAAVVTTPTAKGAASGAVTQRLPDVMARDCRPCKSRHISDSAMRTTALAAGLELQPGTAPPVLQPRPTAKRPAKPDARGLAAMVDAYLRLLGPATSKDVADYLGARRADLEEYWPDDLVEVSVDGQRAWIPQSAEKALAAAKPVDVVRLLGGFDPFLQARDRNLLVPDKAAQKALWPVLGRPGALLVDGEVVGVWRPKTSGKKLTLAVEAFAPLPESVWQQVEAEAERTAAYRGAISIAVHRV
jgi:hypothetical protein